MNNPWKEIALSDYENHMSLEDVQQLQELNRIMKEQFKLYPIISVMVLGVAGGNGLEHIDLKKYKRVVGVDINQQYLEEAKKRYMYLGDALELICLDLINEADKLPPIDMLISNLLIEYIGYEAFQRVVKKTNPQFISCVIQINESEEFVSNSPYLHAFDRLEEVHCQMESEVLMHTLDDVGYKCILSIDYPLPNGKKLVRLDFKYQ